MCIRDSCDTGQLIIPDFYSLVRWKSICRKIGRLAMLTISRAGPELSSPRSLCDRDVHLVVPTKPELLPDPIRQEQPLQDPGASWPHQCWKRQVRMHIARPRIEGKANDRAARIDRTGCDHIPVSYTHLDVYKRQGVTCAFPKICYPLRG